MMKKVTTHDEKYFPLYKKDDLRLVVQGSSGRIFLDPDLAAWVAEQGVTHVRLQSDGEDIVTLFPCRSTDEGAIEIQAGLRDRWIEPGIDYFPGLAEFDAGSWDRQVGAFTFAINPFCDFSARILARFTAPEFKPVSLRRVA